MNQEHRKTTDGRERELAANRSGEDSNDSRSLADGSVFGNGKSEIKVIIVEDNKPLKKESPRPKVDQYQDHLLKSPVLKEEFHATASSHFGMSMISASDVEQSPGQGRSGRGK